MNYSELAPAYIRAIAPYQPGKPISELERELGITGIVKLASNENPLGCSPLATAAMHEAIKTIALYPDGNGFELKEALHRRYGVGHARMVLGNGSNDMLELAARAFLAPGDKAVYSDHAFAVYPLATQAVGATGISVPAISYGHDLDAMRKAAVAQHARLVFVANPNNPTGTFLSAADLLDFMRALPEDILVVLDEAYNEYLPAECRYDSVGWLEKFPNLIVSRTFSKAYGLAGLRVGYAFADAQVADMMNRVRQPFNVNSVAQAAAVAALQDEDFVRRTNELNRRGMEQITRGLSGLGLEFIPSYGNFISFRIGNGMKNYRRLLELGVIVRPVASYDMPDYLRVSIGLEPENEKFLTALKQVMGENSMIIVMGKDVTDEQVGAVVKRLETAGLKANISRGIERTVIGAIGDERPLTEEMFTSLPGVESAMHIAKQYKIVSRESHKANTVIDIGGIPLGGNQIQVIAGPCSVETQEQMDLSAKFVHEAGCRMMRGGAFKPRTSPYTFQGKGVEGLDIFRKAASPYKLPIVTELMDVRQIEVFMEYDVDVIQIGTRNMQNFDLLKEVGRINKPVILKRGMSATISEWLMSAEYIAAGGNHNIIFCERGIRTFETYYRNVLDVTAIPVLKKETHLPVIVDPSHAGGKAWMVPALSQAAIAAGADGLLVEMHPNPCEAWCDADQALTPQELKKLMGTLGAIAGAVGRTL